MSRGIRRALVIAAWIGALACGACAGDDGLAITRWELAGEVAARPGEVAVPGKLPVAARAGTYTLRAEVAIPAAWRDAPLSLWIADLPATVALRVDGVAVPQPEGRGVDGYRTRGPVAWPLPPPAARGDRVVLELEVEHRWTQSGWWSTAPRVARAGAPPAGAAGVLWLNTYVAIAAAVSLIQLGLTSLAIFLIDRHRRVYLWFGVQLVVVSYYPLHVLGATQGALGVHDTPVLAAALVFAAWASLRCTHELFGLPPPWRGWTWLGAAAAAVFAAFADPFRATPVSGPVAIVLLTAIVGYQIALCGRLAVRHPDRLTARLQLASWIALALTMPPDMLHWLGAATLLEGARPASIGMLLFALCLSMLLSRRHILTLRAEAEHLRHVDEQRADLERLNAELRRQVAERSSQLFAALALAGGRPRGGPELRPGEVVGDRYRVIRALGRGGMGTVHEVERLADGRRLALKLTHDLHGTALARLAREALIATRIEHPNVVAVVDVAVADGFLYLVMELVDGAPLSTTRERWGDAAWAVPVLVQVADALEALHAAGVVHRDLKPANVLVAGGLDAPRIKVTDFGVSRPTSSFGSDDAGSGERAAVAAELDAAPPPDGEPTSTTAVARGGARDGATAPIGEPTAARLAAAAMEAHELDPLETLAPGAPPRGRDGFDGAVTRTGLLVGTPPYIAPEMAAPRYVPAPPADVFALGVIAFELLAGERPFARPPALARIAGVTPAPAPSLAARCPAAAPALVALVDACLALEPDARPTAAEVAAGLRAVTPATT